MISRRELQGMVIPLIKFTTQK